MSDRNSEIEAVVARLARREGGEAGALETPEPAASQLGDALLYALALDDARVERLTAMNVGEQGATSGDESDVVRAAMEAAERDTER